MNAGPVCIFAHRGEYDAVHQAVSVAASAAALGRPVQLYLFWWALERVVKGQLDEPDLPRDDVSATMERRGVPSIRALLEAARAGGATRVYACTGSMASLGLTPPDVEPKVDELVGWATIHQRTSGVVDRFFF